jgi:hypothetical protein
VCVSQQVVESVSDCEEARRARSVLCHGSDKRALVFFSDVMSLGITLVGHQKKIMSSIQTMRAQMLHLHGTGIQV